MRLRPPRDPFDFSPPIDLAKDAPNLYRWLNDEKNGAGRELNAVYRRACHLPTRHYLTNFTTDIRPLETALNEYLAAYDLLATLSKEVHGLPVDTHPASEAVRWADESISMLELALLEKNMGREAFAADAARLTANPRLVNAEQLEAAQLALDTPQGPYQNADACHNMLVASQIPVNGIRLHMRQQRPDQVVCGNLAARADFNKVLERLSQHLLSRQDTIERELQGVVGGTFDLRREAEAASAQAEAYEAELKRLENLRAQYVDHPVVSVLDPELLRRGRASKNGTWGLAE